MVKWSRECGSYIYICDYGCRGFDFEGEQEARDALLGHECRGMAA